MSDDQRIIDTIAEHRPYGLDCKCGEPINSDTGWATHFLKALRANGYRFYREITPEEETVVW